MAGQTHPGRQRGKGDTAGRTSAPVEQVGRRWPGRRRRGREPEVGENLPNDDGVLDGGYDAHAAATPGARQHVHPECVPHEVVPRPLPRRGRRGRLHARDGARIGTRHRRSRGLFARVSSAGHHGIAVRRAARVQSAGGRWCARRDGWRGGAASVRLVGTDGAKGVPPVGDRPGAPPTVRCQHSVLCGAPDYAESAIAETVSLGWLWR